MEVLYIIMRSDIASHTPGKKMAQASHASNAFIKKAATRNVDISKWENSTSQGFGTVLVLETYNFDKTKEDVKILEDWGYVCDIIFDPTYPLIDGNIVHHIPLETCAYVYADDKDDIIIRNTLSKYNLHV